MNIGAVVLAIYLLCRFARKRGGSTAIPTFAAAAEQVTWRTVFLGVLLINLYIFGCVALMMAVSTQLAKIAPSPAVDVVSAAVGILLPIVVLRCAPPWLAWRVLRHLRHPLPARCAFWFTPGERWAALAGFARLLTAAGRYPLDPVPPTPVWKRKVKAFFLVADKGPPGLDAWGVAALAVHAEATGDPERARTYVRSFGHLNGPALPRLVRIFAIELLALSAVRRGDWREVSDLASVGRGRSMPLFRALARGRLGGEVNRPLLLLVWAVAPYRTATFRHVRALLTAERGGEAPVHPVPFPVAHLHLLREEAEGRPVDLARVIALAAAWDGELSAESKGAFLARGMEVGARDPLAAADAVPETVLAELEELAAGAAGGLPEEVVTGWDEWRDTLAGAVVGRLRDRLFAQMEEAAGRFCPDDAEPLPPLLDCFDRWLAMRGAAERLDLLSGGDDVATAWYAGLRLSAWNGACRVINTYGRESHWISHLMFTWVVSVAEALGDDDAAEVNRRNAALCGIPRFTAWQLAGRTPGRVRRALRDGGRRVVSAGWWREVLTGWMRRRLGRPR